MKIDINVILQFLYVVLGSSYTLPWMVEFVSKKVKGKAKIALMMSLSLIVTLLVMWKQGFFIKLNWSDVPVILLSTGTLFGAWAGMWKVLFHDLMNPLKPMTPDEFISNRLLGTKETSKFSGYK